MRARLPRIFLVCLSIAALLRVAVFITSCLNLPVTTDEAITVLQAKRLVEGELQWLMYAQPYMFPVESYLSVPLLWLPRNAFGMRTLTLLEGTALLITWLLLIRQSGSWKATVGGWMWMLFPSSYLLIYTFGYAPPHYLSALLLVSGGLWCGVQSRKEELKLPLRLGLILVAGFGCGLAFANSMFALTLAAPVLITVLFCGNWKSFLLRIPLLGLGTVIGLTPFFYTLKAFPGSHAAVSRHREWGEVWNVLKGRTASFTLPRAMGLGAPVFPDESVYAWNPEALIPLFGILVLLVLLAAILWRCAVHFRSLFRLKCPCLGLADFAIGVSILNLLVFARAARSSSGDFRYLLPLTLVFPFLLAEISKSLPQTFRRALVGVVSVFCLINVTSILLTMRIWSQEHFATEVMNAPDLDPAIERLQELNIEHAYAQYWNAYRLNFITDGAILTSQVYNSRFPTWPLPYKEQVDAHSPAAYVLTRLTRSVKPEKMHRDLELMQMSYTSETLGEFEVFHSFGIPQPLLGMQQVPATEITRIDSGDFEGDLKSKWTDFNLFSRTHSRLQQEGMAFEVSFTSPIPLSMLRYNLGFWREDEPGALHVEAMIQGKWVRVLENGVPEKLPFTYHQQRPVYAGHPRRLAFGPVVTDRIRIVLASPRTDRAWTFAEVDFWTDSRETAPADSDIELSSP